MRRLRLLPTIVAAALLLGVPHLLPLLHAHEHESGSVDREDCSVCAFSKHAPALSHHGPALPVVVSDATACGPGMRVAPRSIEPHARGERAPPALS